MIKSGSRFFSAIKFTQIAQAYLHYPALHYWIDLKPLDVLIVHLRSEGPSNRIGNETRHQLAREPCHLVAISTYDGIMWAGPCAHPVLIQNGTVFCRELVKLFTKIE